MSRIAAILFVALFIACSAPPRMYEGPLRNRGEIATIRGTFFDCKNQAFVQYGFNMLRIDSASVESRVPASAQTGVLYGRPIEILPDTHTVVVTRVEFICDHFSSEVHNILSDTATLEFVAEPKHNYILSGRALDNGEEDWEAWIEDDITGEKVSWKKR